LERVEPIVKDVVVSVEPDIFFLPLRREEIAPNLFVVHGDMFISDMDTITISVNTVGVMGKGLASRFKYMYPAAYVAYQDMVKSGILAPGRPAFYKTEDRGFLFFPTKRHWREKSKLGTIEEGLRWFVRNYRNYGVKSIAFPALGCGLGGLKWEEVGPLMYRYLREVDIPVEIYLPMENVREEYFHREFYER
jgi:O-acetyl-ADP-ribose deacetylase (regulator of RNase III)